MHGNTRQQATPGRRHHTASTTRAVMGILGMVGGVLAILAVVALVIVTRGLGWTPVSVKSGSMAPEIPVGALIFVHEVDPDSIRTGDVITFDPPGEAARTTHRVVSRTFRNGHWYFETKGDANPAPDDWRRGLANPGTWQRDVTYQGDAALRHVVTIPWLGWLARTPKADAAPSVLHVVAPAAASLWVLLLIWRRPGSDTAAPEPDDVDDVRLTDGVSLSEWLDAA